MNPDSRAQAAPEGPETVRRWSLAECGLPSRTIGALRTGSVRSMGQLLSLSDSDLAGLPRLGKQSLGAVRRLRLLGGRIEAGVPCFPDAGSLLGSFLNPKHRDVIEDRFGLKSGHPETLQAVASRRHLSRERVRQIEAAALRVLSSRPASACLRQVLAPLLSAIQGQHGIATPAETNALPPAPALGAYRPASLMALATRCGAGVTETPAGFSTLPPPAIRRMTALGRRQLESAGAPCPLALITAAVAPRMSGAGPESDEAQIRRLLDAMPDVSATEDDRYFLTRRGAAHLIAEILGKAGRPLHCRVLWREYNSRVRPDCRLGIRGLLDSMAHSPLLSRQGNGNYGLRIGSQSAGSTRP